MSWYERPYAGGGGGGSGWGFADNPLGWAPTIGHVAGIRVRVHMWFILFIIWELLSPHIVFRAQALVVLFGSVFLHELGHCFAARRVGGRADEILMWPLGGLAFVDAPRAPWSQFVTVVCGPLVNVVLFVVAWIITRSGVLRADVVNWFPYHSNADLAWTWGNPRMWISLLGEMNLYMFLFNLWPMYPMDGGRMLQCALWPRMGYRRSMGLAASVGMVAAIVMGLFALATQEYLMLGIALLGYLTCRNERIMLREGPPADDLFGPSLSEAFRESDKQRRVGWFRRWRQRRAEIRRRRQSEAAAAEQAEVDRILDKVHEHGLHSLTRSERATLQHATDRQRHHV